MVVERTAGPPRTAVVVGIGTPIGAAVRAGLLAAGHRIVGCNLTRTPATRSALINRVLDETDRVVDALVVCCGVDGTEPVADMVSQHHFGTLEVLDGLRPALAAGRTPAAVVVISNTLALVPLPDGRLIDALAGEGEAAAQRLAATTDPSEVRAMVDVALARAVRGRVIGWGRAGVRLNAVAAGAQRGSASAPVRAPATDGRTTGSLRSMIEALPVPRPTPVGAAEVARVVEFLVDPASSAVHGAVLYADGGTDALVRPDGV